MLTTRFGATSAKTLSPPEVSQLPSGLRLVRDGPRPSEIYKKTEFLSSAIVGRHDSFHVSKHVP